MTNIGRSTVFLTLAWLLATCPSANPALAQVSGVAASAAAASPGRGALAGFVATPQTEGAGNRAFVIAPNSAWFLATSPQASVVRLIDINTGITLRYLTNPGLHIAGLSISPDSKTVFALDDDGHVVAWDAATGRSITTAEPADFHDITRLSLVYEGNDEETRVTPELLSRYHILSHFPELKKFDSITINPTQDYAIIGYVGEGNWNAFQIWNLKQEKSEVFFRFGDNACGSYSPSAFDYDGKHLIFGNSGGESDPNHLDFAVFQIAHFGPDAGPKSATATLVLGRQCTAPAGLDAGSDQDFEISPDARFITRGGSSEWTAWDLGSGRKVVSIRADGPGGTSADGSTFAVLHGLERDGSRSKQLMTVGRGGGQRTFEIPASMQSDSWQPVVLSSDGQWIASQVGETVAVWSSRNGKLRSQYDTGKEPSISTILRVSNSGDPLLINDHDGSAFVSGTWRPARSDENGLIVPFTPNFRAQCGVIFCDRVVAELGVVERKRVDGRAREAVREDLSPDGRFMTVRLGYDKGANIVDVAGGHVVMHIDQYRPRFTPDGRFMIVKDFAANGFVKYRLATGKRVWTASPSWGLDGFYMILVDGHVRISRSRHVDLWLVRGFDVRPLDAAAAKQFLDLPDPK